MIGVYGICWLLQQNNKLTFDYIKIDAGRVPILWVALPYLSTYTKLAKRQFIILYTFRTHERNDTEIFHAHGAFYAD